jgi:hypothetical protein
MGVLYQITSDCLHGRPVISGLPLTPIIPDTEGAPDPACLFLHLNSKTKTLGVISEASLTLCVDGDKCTGKDMVLILAWFESIRALVPLGCASILTWGHACKDESICWISYLANILTIKVLQLESFVRSNAFTMSFVSPDHTSNICHTWALIPDYDDNERFRSPNDAAGIVIPNVVPMLPSWIIIPIV